MTERRAKNARNGRLEHSFAGSCRSRCYVCGPNPRPESQSFIEPMHTGVCSTALHKHVVAVFRPRVGQRGSNYSFPMTAAPQIGMGDNVFQKPVASSPAQQIRCNNEHTGCSDSALIIGDEHVDSRMLQRAPPDALGVLSRLR
jgi:hypothetical protein